MLAYSQFSLLFILKMETLELKTKEQPTIHAQSSRIEVYNFIPTLPSQFQEDLHFSFSLNISSMSIVSQPYPHFSLSQFQDLYNLFPISLIVSLNFSAMRIVSQSHSHFFLKSHCFLLLQIYHVKGPTALLNQYDIPAYVIYINTGSLYQKMWSI